MNRGEAVKVCRSLAEISGGRVNGGEEEVFYAYEESDGPTTRLPERSAQDTTSFCLRWWSSCRPSSSWLSFRWWSSCRPSCPGRRTRFREPGRSRLRLRGSFS